MDQEVLDLDGPRARRTDPETSHAAARSVRNVTAKQVAVLRRLADEPSTDEDLVDRVDGQTPSGIRTRRSELVRAGLVVDSGVRAELRSGRLGIVWTVTERGREMIR